MRSSLETRVSALLEIQSSQADQSSGDCQAGHEVSGWTDEAQESEWHESQDDGCDQVAFSLCVHLLGQCCLTLGIIAHFSYNLKYLLSIETIG